MRGNLKEVGPQPGVSVDVRVDLLAPKRTSRAYDEMLSAFAALSLVLKQDGYPEHDWDVVLPEQPQWVEAVDAVAALTEAVRADLIDGDQVSRQRVGWRRARRG